MKKYILLILLFASPCFGFHVVGSGSPISSEADLIRYVDTDVSGGNDDGTSWENAYDHLADCLVSEATDLTSLGQRLIIYVRASGGTADSVVASVTGFTVSSDYYVCIRAESTDKAGPAWSSSKYRLAPNVGSSNTSAISIANDYTVIDGVQIQGISSYSSQETVKITNTAVNLITIKNCYIRVDDGASAIGIMIGNQTNTNSVLVQNSIIEGSGWTGIHASTGGAQPCALIYNCVIYGNTTNGIYAYSNRYVAKNCAVFGNGDDFNGSATIDYCASDDGDGTNAVSPYGADWANEFNAHTANDFTLLNSGNLYLGSPITNADDSYVPTDDIEGDARNTSVGTNTSIGEDEY